LRGRGVGGEGLRYLAILLILIALMLSTALTLRQNDLTPASLPTTLTLIGWAAALILLLLGVWRRIPLLLVGAALIELWLAAQILPYNQLVPPEAYSAQRFTISQLLAYQDDQSPEPPGRILSISQLLFDPGDRATLEARYANLSPEARSLAFDAVKMKEVLAANLPLIWGIPSVDGFDGGLLPTAYYTAFTSLFLPPDQLRTIDGRLREILAREDCGGACIPDWRWLGLMNIRHLITDKNYDLVQDGIFYDTQLEGLTYSNPQQFVGDVVDVLCNPCTILYVMVHHGANTVPEGDPVVIGAYMRQRFRLPSSYNGAGIDILTDDPVQAVTLVDTRTGDFQQLTPAPWSRVLSSDIKLYYLINSIPRAFIATTVSYVRDDDLGTEDTLNLMRDPAFRPDQLVIIAGAGENSAQQNAGTLHRVQFATYTDTHITLTIDTPEPGYLVLTDAYYPGWTATINGDPVPVERADVMFRAVRVRSGQSEVVFEYRPAWLPAAPLIGGAAWLAALIALLVTQRRSRYHVSTSMRSA
jgi:hypothetical protein